MFAAARLAGLFGITVTGVVYGTVLSEVHTPHGFAEASTNAVFHYAAPPVWWRAGCCSVPGRCRCRHGTARHGLADRGSAWASRRRHGLVPVPVRRCDDAWLPCRSSSTSRWCSCCCSW
ncbi:MAG: hypothetical protein R2695_19765 [Acidimicrobiales bacterium]